MSSVYGGREHGRTLPGGRFFSLILALLVGAIWSLSAADAASPVSIPWSEGGFFAPSSLPAVVPNDPLWDREWYMRQIKADQAWTVSTGTPDVVVAIIDVGVDITHPDLRDVIWTNPREQPGDGIDNDRNGFIDDIQGWNFVNNTSDVRPLYKPFQSEDAWSHGTMVASLIGAKGNDGLGMLGVAWNIRLMPLVALDADGAGSTQDIIRAIDYAITMGVEVINLSLAGYEEDPALTDMIHRASQAGIVVVAANGNNNNDRVGTNIDEVPSYPACGEKAEDAIIGVGGTDTQDQKAPYANFGSRCTDISAPGFELFAARPSYAGESYAGSAPVALYRERVGGTSLAAPLVAGAAALLRSAHPDWTVQQIQERLYTTSDILQLDQLPGTRTVWGYGRLNVGRALRQDPSLMTSVVLSSAPSSAPLLPPTRKKIVLPKIPFKMLISLQQLVSALK